MSRGALTFSETAKVMHITFACLLCKISNDLETPSFSGASAHLQKQQQARRPGWRARGPLSALLCIHRDATLITLAKTARKITAVAGGKGKKKKKKRKKNPLNRGAASPPAWPRSRAGRRGHRIDGRGGLMATGRFDGYDCKKKSRLVHSGPQTMSAKTKETKK